MITPNHADLWAYYTPDDHSPYAAPVVAWSPHQALVCTHDGFLIQATSAPGFDGFGIRPEVQEGENFEIRGAVRALSTDGRRPNGN